MAAGRPRTFCTEKALDSAMQVFWRKGYEGASMVDLTAAIGHQFAQPLCRLWQQGRPVPRRAGPL